MRIKRLQKNGKIKWLLIRQLAVIMVLMLLLSNGIIAAHADPSAQKMGKIPNVIITGSVKDDKGQTLPGVSVILVGTTIGTVTDLNGNFKISVPDNATTSSLSFSFVGFIKQQ